MIKFICKSENNVEKNQERTNEFILRNKKIINRESEDLYPVLDICNQQYHIFEKAETGRLVKKMTQIRVRLELEK